GTVITFAGQEIEPAVAVEIQGGHASAGVGRRTAAAVLGNIRELAVAVVAKEDTRGRQRAVLAVSAVGDVQIEPAVIAEIDKESAAALAGGAELFLLVEAEFSVIVGEEKAGFRAGVVESADEEIGPTVAVHVAPGGGVAADAGQVRKDARLVAHVAEDEWIRRRGSRLFFVTRC